MDQSSTSKDPNTAMVIEIVAGYFGLLGMGYLYAGRTAAGLLRLFGYWIFLGLMVIAAFGLSVAPIFEVLANPMDYQSAPDTSFLAVVCLLCMIPVILAVPIISGLTLKHSMS